MDIVYLFVYIFSMACRFTCVFFSFYYYYYYFNIIFVNLVCQECLMRDDCLDCWFLVLNFVCNIIEHSFW